MARMGGDTRMKREVAPPFWRISRKKDVFVFSVSPGPHPKREAYSLGVLVRDVFKAARSGREAELVLKQGKVLVDGRVRRDPGFPVGVMDVISIPSLKAHYRVLPSGETLVLHAIDENEARIKPCRVKTKQLVKGGRVQIGLHDGKALLVDGQEVRVGDTCVIRLPDNRLEQVIPLKQGVLAIALKGKSGGRLGRVIALEEGSITSDPAVTLDIGGEQVKALKEHVLALGLEAPVISLPQP
jgi:small subunit ribosomal protein S4e